jgi:Pectate lyase superfamily protein
MVWKTGDVVGPTNLNSKTQATSKVVAAANYPRGTSGITANDNATAVNAAVAAAPGLGATAVFVDASLVPYNASLVTFNANVRMIREGGNPAFWDVQAYGADPAAVLDATAALQAAITAIPVGGGGVPAGGVVYFPQGTYAISGTLTVTTNAIGVTLSGPVGVGGAGVAVIRTTSATADMLSATGCQLLTIAGIQFESRITRTAGRGIVFSGVNEWTVSDCRFIDCYNTFDILASSNDGFITRCRILGGSNVTNRGIFIQNSQVFFITNFLCIMATGSFGGTNAALQLDSGTDGCAIDGFQSAPVPNNFATGGRGLWLTNTLATNAPVYTRLSNFYAEGSVGNGIQIDACTDFKAKNVYIATSNQGIGITGGTSIRFSNFVVFNNQQHGVNISGGSKITFDHGDITDNSIQTNATYSHIAVAGGTDISIDHCAFGNFLHSNANSAANGVAIFNNTQGAMVTDCRFDSTKMTTPINDSSGTAYKRGNRFNLASEGAVQGRAVLVAGTVTVSTTEVLTGDNIQITGVVAGGTPGFLSIGTITNNTSFVINSTSALDTSTVFWEIAH